MCECVCLCAYVCVCLCESVCLCVCLLGGSIHTLKEKAETLVAATREIGLELNTDKT